MRGEFLDLGGIRLYYYAAGSRGAGEPIVLLHGFPTSAHLWSDVVPLLPPGHRVVVLDLLGFGRSDPPSSSAPVDIRSHAERVVAVLDKLGINFACLVGHDVGGGIAQSVAVRHPQRVSKLCLIDSVAFDAWPTKAAKLARAMVPLTRHLPASWISQVVRADLLRGFLDAEKGAHDVDVYLRPFCESNGRDALLAHLTALNEAETMAIGPRLKDIVSPTAIVWGERDPFLSLELARRLHGAIPGSTLEIVPGARHFLPEESAHAVAAAITRLVAA
jgi:pimeloyl-ACP methyl ester carboxylesterase